MSVVKVAHIFKRIERIELNIEELLKMGDALPKNRDYHESLFLSIEKEINHLLDEKIKLMDLKIEDPPEKLKPENQVIYEEEPDSDSYIHPMANFKPVNSEFQEISESKNYDKEVQPEADSTEITNSQIDDEEKVAGAKAQERVSSLEKFARSLDLSSKSGTIKDSKNSEVKKNDVPSSAQKSRKDILSGLAQIDY